MKKSYLITLKITPMKNNILSLNFLILLLITVSFSNCNAQIEDNPKYLGNELGSFDLDKVTFEENIDTLFSKIDHVNLDRTNTINKVWVYRNKLDAKKKDDFISFFSIQNFKINVIANEKKQVEAFTTFAETKSNPDVIISEIDKKYGKYRTKLKLDKKLEFSNSKLYQWNLPDRIYAVTISDLNNIYTLSIVVAKSSITKNTMNIDLSPICLDESCKQ